MTKSIIETVPNKSGYIPAVDFWKAFDSISKDFFIARFQGIWVCSGLSKVGLSLNQGHC